MANKKLDVKSTLKYLFEAWLEELTGEVEKPVPPAQSTNPLDPRGDLPLSQPSPSKVPRDAVTMAELVRVVDLVFRSVDESDTTPRAVVVSLALYLHRVVSASAILSAHAARHGGSSYYHIEEVVSIEFAAVTGCPHLSERPPTVTARSPALISFTELVGYDFTESAASELMSKLRGHTTECVLIAIALSRQLDGSGAYHFDEQRTAAQFNRPAD